MTCDTVQTELLAKATHEWALLEPHLSQCPACSALAAAIRTGEFELTDALDAFADAGDFDAALQNHAAQAPPTTRWSPIIMATFVLASAAAALLVSSWRTADLNIFDASVGSEASTASDQAPVPAPTPIKEQSPPNDSIPSPTPIAPAQGVEDRTEGVNLQVVKPESVDPEDVRPEVVTPENVDTDAVAEAPHVEEATSSHACWVNGDLETRALKGKLKEADVSCLESQLASDSQADAEGPLRLLSVDAYARKNMDDWERHTLRLSSIVEDPDLHYKLGLHYSKDQPAAALHHANVAFGMMHVWPDGVRANRVHGLIKIRASASLALWNEDPSDFAAKEQAAEAARAWLRHARQAGLNDERPLEMCLTAAPEEWCEVP